MLDHLVTGPAFTCFQQLHSDGQLQLTQQQNGPHAPFPRAQTYPVSFFCSRGLILNKADESAVRVDQGADAATPRLDSRWVQPRLPFAPFW